MEDINRNMQMRMALLEETGYNVENAKKCWDFVCGETKKQEPTRDKLEDGVYLINTKGNAVRYNGENTKTVNDIVYIGVVQGSHSVAISLHDVSKNEITLTEKESEDDCGGYKDSYMDAVQDWDGKFNTELLKKIGLAFYLKNSEYIPALAELYLICINQKVINEALRFVGGQELNDWYWSSTEYNMSRAWRLSFNYGGADTALKAEYEYKIRPVSTFLPNN